MSHEITCADCTASYTTNRTNTKYCRTCRLFRDCMFIKNTTKKCLECDRKFSPLTRNDLLCGNCDFLRPSVHGECGLCGQESEKLLHETVRVCSMCATDPSKRTLFIRALAKKRRRNKDG